ncbi:MBL fold metallo-hydrolase [Pseudonocardia alni]|uniref:Glyoxylase-like metal-dependent hydrolase (Beta-lactamase superfamily II) n=1 Tax=Pseudonocardia alni TaxID=33907 RepID=A0A852W578_PSEA5|nr:MBL fold metallo-hydrolase [Pseudonocardia antarctica]NYG04123.1 glyoxylase-like metal-dependent hydrolase (beta-lactamase superfamily II) [Pseudonocardia antarctica]
MPTGSGSSRPDPAAPRVTTIELGDVQVTRVMEFSDTTPMTTDVFFPNSKPEEWQRHASVLDPDHWDAKTDLTRAATQTWVLRSEGKTILIDTGAGNGKYRPLQPIWSYMDTDYLGNLAAAGVGPEDVDIVVNTHLHDDHVGWNTRLEGRDWVPTFPNATYLMPQRDFEYWKPENLHNTKFGRGNQNVYEDSIDPVIEAGLVTTWDESHVIDANLRLELAPGHTPGASIIHLESAGERAIFAGDLLHGAIQVHEPHINSCFEEDEDGARASRARMFAHAAEHRALVLPAHLPGHGAFELRRRPGGYGVAAWAPFSRT